MTSSDNYILVTLCMSGIIISNSLKNTMKQADLYYCKQDHCTITVGSTGGFNSSCVMTGERRRRNEIYMFLMRDEKEGRKK